MRNRDRPASGFKSDQYRDGLTKREASALANMAQLMGPYGALPGEDEEAREMAKAAVQFADALFDELDGPGGDLKRQRDEAYRALVDIRDGGRTAEGQTAASQRAQAALDAISEMSSPSPDQAHGSAGTSGQ